MGWWLAGEVLLMLVWLRMQKMTQLRRAREPRKQSLE